MPPSSLSSLLDEVVRLYPKKLPQQSGDMGGAIDLSLDRIIHLLEKIDSPHKNLPPHFHIAGTNGKGSCFAFITQMLRQKGVMFHGLTSPHLIRFNERILLKGAAASDSDLIAALHYVLEKNQGERISFFEITTAAALWLFAQQPAQVLVIEVGLGGRLDATNVIESAKTAVFTPIALDHQEYLGNSLEKIAWEKSGIINHHTRHIISAPQESSAMAVLQQTAQKFNKEIIIPHYQKQQGDLVVRFNDKDSNLGKPSLAGDHQYMNGAVGAMAVWQFFGGAVPLDILQKSIASTRWLGRLTDLSSRLDDCKKKLHITADKNKNPELWLDGCHNPHGVKALVAWLNQQEAKKTAVIFALLHNRTGKDFLSPFQYTKQPIEFFPTSFAGDHQLNPPLTLATTAQSLQLKATAMEGAMDDWQTTLVHVLQKDFDRIIICGSLYLLGQVLSFLE